MNEITISRVSVLSLALSYLVFFVTAAIIRIAESNFDLIQKIQIGYYSFNISLVLAILSFMGFCFLLVRFKYNNSRLLLASISLLPVLVAVIDN